MHLYANESLLLAVSFHFVCSLYLKTVRGAGLASAFLDSNKKVFESSGNFSAMFRRGLTSVLRVGSLPAMTGTTQVRFSEANCLSTVKCLALLIRCSNIPCAAFSLLS